MMNKNLLLPIIFLCGILVGFFVPSLLGNVGISTNPPPADHQAIANQVFIHDDTYNIDEKLVFMRSGHSRMMTVLPANVRALDTYAGILQYSVWEFRAVADDASDINAFLVVWGPSEEGHYLLEISRSMGNAATVTYPDNGVLKTVSWAKNSLEGYICAQA